MRITRLIASVVLTSALILLLCVNSLATSASTQLIDIYLLEAEYRGGNFVYYEPTLDTDDRVSFVQIPNVYNEDDTLLLSSLTLMGYGMNESIDFQHGYIYTFNYHIRISGVNGSSVTPTVSLGLAETNLDSEISKSIPIGDVTYQEIIINQRITEYACTSVVYVDETFNNAGIDLETASIILTFSNMFLESSSTVSIYSSDMSVQKAVGEDAYYQASLDAITNLPASEYGYIYNSMPDSEGEIDVIQGQLLDVLQAYDPGIQQLVQSLRTEESRPCVYLPEVHVPFVDVHIWDNHIFYVDDYLNDMNPKIMTYIDTFLTFIRLVFFITFSTFTIYKISRIEWWY